MWLHKLRQGLFPRSLKIGLSSRFVYVLGAKGTSGAQIHLPCDSHLGSPGEPWFAAVKTLSAWLKEQGDQSLRLQIALSGRFSRWQVVPWQDELSSPQERQSFATLRYRDIFGAVAEQWNVKLSAMPPGRSTPACAVDQGLIDALLAECGSSRVRIDLIAPYFSLAFDHWKHQLKGNSCWFALLEDDCLSLGLLDKGQWLSLRSQRLDGDWRAQLPAMMTQSGIASELQDQAASLYLAGDLVAPPLPLSPSGPRFDWLAPRGYAQGVSAQPGLRLALGI